MANGVIKLPLSIVGPLWTNPNPTSDFAAQTINVDCSGYDFIAVEHKVYSGLDQRRIDFGKVGTEFGLTHPAGGAGYKSPASMQIGCRSCDNSDPTKLVFSIGMAGQSTGFTQSNNRCIPYRIYGIKGLITP